MTPSTPPPETPSPPPLPVKLAIQLANRTSNWRGRNVPRLRRIITDVALYFIPVLLWLLLFSCGVRLIPDRIKPPINVTILPTVDSLMGSSVTWWERKNDSFSWVDMVAAVPYTVHPLLPVVFLLTYGMLGGGGRVLLKFVLAFGLMNLGAVVTHLVFPTAPPWYYLNHGFAPASYDMKGDPAVLAVLDERFGMQMYHKMYAEAGKVVFGAWPSLHAAWPYLMARFRPALPWRGIQVFQWVYAMIVWWAAIYLRHHYLADLLGGILYAEMAYQVANIVGVGKGRGSKDDVLPLVVKQDI